MSDTKNGILFYIKDSVPLTFTEYKIYDLGTGYIALYDELSKSCCLCRILDDREISSCSNKSTLVIKKEQNIIEKYVILITSLINLQEADKLINKYRIVSKQSVCQKE